MLPDQMCDTDVPVQQVMPHFRPRATIPRTTTFHDAIINYQYNNQLEFFRVLTIGIENGTITNLRDPVNEAGELPRVWAAHMRAHFRPLFSPQEEHRNEMWIAANRLVMTILAHTQPRPIPDVLALRANEQEEGGPLYDDDDEHHIIGFWEAWFQGWNMPTLERGIANGTVVSLNTLRTIVDDNGEIQTWYPATLIREYHRIHRSPASASPVHRQGDDDRGTPDTEPQLDVDITDENMPVMQQMDIYQDPKNISWWRRLCCCFKSKRRTAKQ